MQLDDILATQIILGRPYLSPEFNLREGPRSYSEFVASDISLNGADYMCNIVYLCIV